MKYFLLSGILASAILFSSAAPALAAVKAKAHAICRDGTISYSVKRQGTCSHHRGVKKWLY